MTRRALEASALLFVALLVGPVLAEADAPAPPQAPRSEPKASEDHQEWVYEMGNELMSPFCPGRTLADCPSPDAASLRMWIAVQAAAGRSRADIEEELYAKYGEVMRGAPKAEGIGLAAYWIPAAAFAAGGALVGWFLLRATRRSRERERLEPPPSALDPEQERKLDEMLAEPR